MQHPLMQRRNDLDQSVMPCVDPEWEPIQASKEFAMYSNILCGIDGSDLSSKALQHALALAARTGAKVTAVTVTEPSVVVTPGAEMMLVDTSAMIAELDKAKAENAKTVLADAEKSASASGAGLTGLHVANSHAAEGILMAAKQINAD